jgi:ABC-2 type transport system permease protein
MSANSDAGSAPTATPVPTERKASWLERSPVKGTSVIFRRELAGLFLQPFLWVLLAAALVLQGVLQFAILQQYQGDVHLAILGQLGTGYLFWALVVVLSPLVTMRMISEEAKSGVLEFLLTAPVSDFAVVLGKLLAATTFFVVLWAPSLIQGLLFSALGATPDWGLVLSAYFGAILVSALFCALGLFASALSNTPALAAFLGFLFCLGALIVPQFQGLLRGVDREVVDAAFRTVDVVGRYQASFLRGAFDSAHLIFFLAWIGALMFLTVRLVEMRRWRG